MTSRTRRESQEPRIRKASDDMRRLHEIDSQDTLPAHEQQLQEVRVSLDPIARIPANAIAGDPVLRVAKRDEGVIVEEVAVPEDALQSDGRCHDAEEDGAEHDCACFPDERRSRPHRACSFPAPKRGATA